MEQENAIPEELLCPITHRLMEDPMMLIDSGITYDRAAIVHWFQVSKQSQCPVTRKQVEWPPRLVPNIAIRSMVQRLQHSAPHHSVPQQVVVPQPSDCNSAVSDATEEGDTGISSMATPPHQARMMHDPSSIPVPWGDVGWLQGMLAAAHAHRDELTDAHLLWMVGLLRHGMEPSSAWSDQYMMGIKEPAQHPTTNRHTEFVARRAGAHAGHAVLEPSHPQSAHHCCRCTSNAVACATHQ